MSGRILVVGSSNTDMVIKSERLPAPGETIIGGKFETFAGGKGANQAVAARRAGGDVTLLAAVGDDPLGRQALENFKRDGIETALIKVVPDVASGVALIMIGRDGENMIAVAPGANHFLTPDDIAAVDFSRFAFVLLQLEIPLETVRSAALAARQAGCTVVLNPAPASVLPGHLLAAVDILTPNRGELGLIAHAPVASEMDLAAAAASLQNQGVGQVVVTLGAEGSLWLDGPSPVPIRGLPVQAVDTVGAGDCFNGCLVAALSRDGPMRVALDFATAGAALSVQRPGAQNSMPRRAEIERLLSEIRPA